MCSKANKRSVALRLLRYFRCPLTTLCAGYIKMQRALLFFQPTRLLYLDYCLFVLRFYNPENPMGSCLARLVFLTTLLLAKLMANSADIN